MTKNKLTERLDQGPVICAEGFLFEIERRGIHGIRRICANGFIGPS